MRMTQRHWLVAILIAIILAIVAWAFWPDRTASLPVALEQAGSSSEENETATSSTSSNVLSAVPARPVSSKLPAIAEDDTLLVWDFTGVYADRPELIAKAQNNIARFTSLLATATSSTVSLLVSIANEYELLGKGKEQYEYLGRAIRADGAVGLPWHNLGVLMERLGAFKTARDAYEQATLVQPKLSEWHYAYLGFLMSRMKDDAATITKALATAEANLGQDSYLEHLRSKWLNP